MIEGYRGRTIYLRQIKITTTEIIGKMQEGVPYNKSIWAKKIFFKKWGERKRKLFSTC
jgi:hypothetical protein